MSRFVSRASAALLLAGGIALLFVPDAILPRLAPGFPAGALWLGQLLGAALLALAALDWLSRDGILGGIYGRPVVFANAAFYFIGAMVVLRAATRATRPAALLLLAVPLAALAVAYGVLLFRGPFDARVGARDAG